MLLAAESTSWIAKLLPGVADNPTRFYNAIRDTLLMVAWSGALMLIFGMILGVALTVTAKGGILQNRVVYEILDKLINILRSIPFVLLIVLLFDVSGAIMGTSSGVKGAIIPLVVGSAPFLQDRSNRRSPASAAALWKRLKRWAADPPKSFSAFISRRALPPLHVARQSPSST